MNMQTKSAAVEIKTNSTPGEFTAVISAVGNVDRQGDRVMPGAFKSAIDMDPIPPVYWAHMHQIPPIGDGVEWYEQGKEVVYKGALFVKGDDEHQYAKMVYAGMKSRDGRSPAINQWSYTYGVPEGGAERVVEEQKNIRLLHQIRPVAEVGPCFIGANADTYTLDAPKSAAAGELVVARKRLGRVPMRQLLADTLGITSKDYGDIDGYEIRMLLEMLDAAVSFIQFSDEDDDTVKMQGVANTLLGMLAAEFAEVTDLMAQGDAIDAILSQDEPNVEVNITVETASTDAETAKLTEKDVAAAELEKPAGESEATAETVTPPVEEEAAPEVGAEAAAEPAAESVEIASDEEVVDDAVTSAANDVSSDDDSTVSDEEIARLLTAVPTH